MAPSRSRVSVVMRARGQWVCRYGGAARTVNTGRRVGAAAAMRSSSSSQPRVKFMWESICGKHAAATGKQAAGASYTCTRGCNRTHEKRSSSAAQVHIGLPAPCQPPPPHTHTHTHTHCQHHQTPQPTHPHTPHTHTLTHLQQVVLAAVQGGGLVPRQGGASRLAGGQHQPPAGPRGGSGGGRTGGARIRVTRSYR